MPHRLARIRAGRHPHEILVCLTALLIGGTGLILDTSISAAIHSTFEPPWRTVYYAGLCLGAGVTLWGIVRHKVEGLLIERAGLGVLACLFLAYTLAIIVDNGTRALAFAVIPLSYTVATIWRGLQIGRDLKLLQAYLQDHPGAIEKRGHAP